MKVLIPRSEANAFVAEPGNREWVSIIEFISRCGQYRPPPYFIFQGKQIQSAWAKGIELDRDTVLQVSQNGWTDREIALNWLKFYDAHTKPRTQGKYRLLVLDGHDSHCTMQFVQYCEENSIVPLCLPPHTTHLLQPLDLGIFGPLAKAYKKQLHDHTRFGTANISKVQFLNFYLTARRDAITSTNIESAWKGAGLVPFDPTRVLEKIRPKTPPTVSLTDSRGRRVEVQISTPLAEDIDCIVERILSNVSPSKKEDVLTLQRHAQKARSDKVIAETINNNLVAKMKTSRK